MNLDTVLVVIAYCLLAAAALHVVIRWIERKERRQ